VPQQERASRHRTHSDEPLFTLQKENDLLSCRLRSYGPARGVEILFSFNGTLLLTRSFMSRAEAIEWAEVQHRKQAVADWVDTDRAGGWIQ
jgi:hypothetical protein